MCRNFVECCIKALSFCILASVLYFIYTCWKKKKFIFMYFISKKAKIFLVFHHGIFFIIYTWLRHFYLHAGTRDSWILRHFFINRSSKYLSHSWSQMLPTFMYHSWVTWGAAGWQTCSKSDSSVSVDPSSCLANIG